MFRIEGQGVFGESHLNEDEVPDLQDIGIIQIDKVGGITAPNPVVVNLCAGPTGALIPHLPKVVLGAEGQNALCWQKLQPATQQQY